MTAHTKTPDNASNAKEDSKRFSKPLQALMVWVDLVSQKSVIKLFEAVGMKYEEYEEFRIENPGLVSEIKQVYVLSQVLDREKTASLMRARFNEVLMGAKTSREVRDLSVAAAKLPDWVFGDDSFYRAPAHFLRALAHDAHNAHADTHTRETQEMQANGVPANSMWKPDRNGGSDSG